MQRHPLQHRFAGSSDSGGSLFSSDLVETTGFRARGLSSDDCEKWHSDRYANGTGELRRSGISLWQPPPRGRSGILYDWIAANGSSVLDITIQRARGESTNR